MRFHTPTERAIPSGSHNAPYSEELGEHWPAGQLFKLLDKRHQQTMKKYYHVKPGHVVVQQIGGEEVNVSLPVADMPALFGISVNEDGEPA